jgi:hypothetical protein
MAKVNVRDRNKDKYYKDGRKKIRTGNIGLRLLQ